jgi:hypothetical protein
MLVEMIINKEEENVSKNSDEKQLPVIVLILTTKFKGLFSAFEMFYFYSGLEYHIKM